MAFKQRLGALRGSETARVTGSSALVVLIRVAGTGATFLYTMLMARLMAPSDFGVVWSIWSGSYIAASLATLNIGSGAVREVIKARGEGNDDVAAGFIVASRLTLLRVVPFVSVGFLLLAWWRSPDGIVEHRWAYILTAIAIPVMGWVQTNAAQATALNQTVKSQTPRDLMRPTLFLIAFSGFTLYQYRPSVDLVVAMYFVSIVLAAIIQFLLLRPYFGFMAGARPDLTHWRDWIVSGMTLAPMLLLADYLKNIIILLSAVSVSSADVGLIAISLSIINFLNFGIVAVDLAFSPKLSAALSKGHRQRAEHFLAVANVLKAGPAIVAAILLLIFAEPLLGLFGKHFVSGASVSAWFLLMPVSRAIFGNSTLVMQVKGHRGEIFWTAIVGIAAMAAAVVMAGHAYGVVGAAAACGIVMATLQMVRYLTCLVMTGIDTSILGSARYLLSRRAQAQT